MKWNTNVFSNSAPPHPPVPAPLGDVDQFLDASRIRQGFGVLHVFAGDLVQSAADGGDRFIWEQCGVPPRQAVHQVPHGVFPWQAEGEGNLLGQTGILIQEVAFLYML